MNIVTLLLLCSLVLVAGSIVLFVFSAGQGDCHEAERISLMPLDDDEATASPPPRTEPTPSRRTTSDD